MNKVNNNSNKSKDNLNIDTNKYSTSSNTGTGKKMVNYELTKSNEKSKGIVEAFGICTTNGITRNYNEDRVSVILNVMKEDASVDKELNDGPHCSYFSVFDGHGGNKCANFLRENLHKYILGDEYFPKDVERALQHGILKSEREFLLKSKSEYHGYDKSGSCAIVALFVDDKLYTANVGDSRSVISSSFGKVKKAITEDHKPGSTKESARIFKAGGDIYRSKIPFSIFNNNGLTSATGKKYGNKSALTNIFNSDYTNSLTNNIYSKNMHYGPERVIPGK